MGLVYDLLKIGRTRRVLLTPTRDSSIIVGRSVYCFRLIFDRVFYSPSSSSVIYKLKSNSGGNPTCVRNFKRRRMNETP